MTITCKHAPRSKEYPYACISQQFIKDFSISLELKALLLYCFTRPPNWQYSVAHLAKVTKISEKKCQKLLSQGIESGYIHRERAKTGNLKSRMIYLFSELKDFSNNVTDTTENDLSENNFENTPILETKRPVSNKFSDTDDFDASKSDSYNKYSSSKEEVRSNERLIPSPKVAHPPEDFSSFGSKVKLKFLDYKKLCDDHGKDKIDATIDSINDYEVAFGKKGYKCYAAAIRQWLKRDKRDSVLAPAKKYPPKKEDWLKINLAHAQGYCMGKRWMMIDSYYVNNGKLPMGRRAAAELDMRIVDPESFPAQLERLASRES